MVLTVGDHIQVKREASFSCPSYYHHGIYIGYQYELGFGQYVVHFSGPDNTKTATKILITTLRDFCNGGNVEVINYPTSNPSLPANTVVRSALYYANNPTKWGAYDLATNNCEHFAISCKTGRKINPLTEQNQVQWYALAAALAMIIIIFLRP